MRACRFSSVRSGLAAGELAAAASARRRPSTARSAARARARRARRRARARRPGSRGGEARGHDRDVHALAAERVGRQAGDERRVDPARDAEHDVLEAVLLDVVAQPERRAPRTPRPRRARSARDASGGGRRPARRVSARVRATRRGRRIGAGSAGAPRRSQRRIAAPPRRARARRRRVEVDVAHQQLLAELRRAGDRRAGVIDDARVPVEDELVLAADEPAEGDAGEVVAGALGEHALALVRPCRRGRGRRRC